MEYVANYSIIKRIENPEEKDCLWSGSNPSVIYGIGFYVYNGNVLVMI